MAEPAVQFQVWSPESSNSSRNANGVDLHIENRERGIPFLICVNRSITFARIYFGARVMFCENH